MKISEMTAKLPKRNDGIATLSLDDVEEEKVITITILEPDKGKWLTQKEVKDEERVFSEKVYLGQGHTSDDWEEWTTELKLAHEELQEQLRNEEEVRMREKYEALRSLM